MNDLIAQRLLRADAPYKKYVFSRAGEIFNQSEKFVRNLAEDFASEISSVIFNGDSVIGIAAESVRRKFHENYFSNDLDFSDIQNYEKKLSEKMTEFYLHFGADKQSPLNNDFFENRIFNSVSEKVYDRGFDVPFYREIADHLEIRFSDWPAEVVEKFYSSLMRLTSGDYWSGIFSCIQYSWIEARARGKGIVCKTKSPYISDISLRRHIEKNRATEKFLDKFCLQSSDGEQIDLRSAYESGISNPEHRRRELMMRIRTTDEFFSELNYKGFFLTITAPARFHSVNVNGSLNGKNNVSEVRDTHRYLTTIWRNAFRRFDRDGVFAAGYRLVEPHHDGTPHWHCLIWFPPEVAESGIAILEDRFCRVDRHEIIGKTGVRFKALPLDPDRGATGYVAAYVSKNVDGHSLEVDFDSGLSAIDGAQRATAWARLHRIRQFQAFGVVGATAWREFRKIRVLPAGVHEVLADFWRAADAGDFREFIRLSKIHGACRIYRSGEDFSGNQIWNRWGERSVRIRGVAITVDGEDFCMVTRTREWEIVPKKSPENILRCGTVADAAGFQDRSAVPWTSGNNCPLDYENFELNSNYLSVEEVGDGRFSLRL